MSRLRIAALAVAVAAACSSPSGPDAPRISVSLDLQAPITPAPVLAADIGGRRVEVPPAARAGESGVEVRGPRYGEVPVRAALVGAAGDTLAAVAFTHRLARGAGHWVSALVGRHRPQGHCIGSVAVAPLRGASDTLFVMYGSIPDGAVC